VTTSEGLLNQLQEARTAGNVEGWGDAAHSLKSSAGSLGLSQVYRAALAVEQACRGGQSAAAAVPSDALPGLLRQGWDLLRARHPAPAPANGSDVRPET
jgi:HPt (histidine-containing phosphotransfer) domain-containing protein